MIDDFTQADTLNLQRLNQGIATIRSQVAEGTLAGEEGAQLEAMIAEQRQPLMERRQMAEQNAEMKQASTIMKQGALAQSMQTAHMQRGANDFMQTTAVFRDPEGNAPTQYFYQKRPGEFAPIQTQDSQDQEEFAPEDMGAFVEDGPQSMPQEPQVQAPPPQPRAEPPGSFRQTIVNGAEETQVIRDGMGRVIGVEGSPFGLQGVVGSAGRNLGNLDERVAKEAWQRADSAVPGDYSPERFRRVQDEFRKQIPQAERDIQDRGVAESFGLSPRQVQLARQQAEMALSGLNPRQRQRQFGSVFNRILGAMGTAQRQRTIELSKEKAEQDREVRRAETRFQAEYSKNFAQIQREVDAMRKGKSEAEIQALVDTPEYIDKPWMFSREAHINEARSRAIGATLDRHPDWNPGQLPNAAGPAAGGQGGAQAKPAPQPSVNRESIKPDADVLKAALAEKARRAAVTGQLGIPAEPLDDEQIKIRKRHPVNPLQR